VELATWYEELKRRRVFRAVVAFGVVAFAVLQVVEPVLHAFHLDDRWLTAVVLALAAAFPLVVVLAWVFDLRGGRIERAAPMAGPAAPSRLAIAFTLVGLGLVAAAPGLTWVLFKARATAVAPAPAAALEGTSAPAGLLASTIAVLPFVDMSPQHDQEFFSDGIAEEILGALAHVPGLRVIGRTSSFAFKGKSEDVASIARKLQAGTLLEGSVRREGDRVRVTAQLVNGTDGVEVWSERFDRQLTGVFAVQDEIARAVVLALRGRVSSPAPAEPASRPTTSPEAYARYLLGRHFIGQPSGEGFKRATEALEQAVALDPGYAPAWASLAYAAFWRVQFETTGPEQAAYTARARAAAEKAVALAPDLAEAYAVRGFLGLNQGWNWKGAEADFQRALTLGSGDAELMRLHARFVLAGQGRLSEAIAELQRIVARDPLSAAAWANLGTLLTYQGKLPEGVVALRRSLEITPGNAIAQCLLSYNLLLQGRSEDSLAAAREIQEPGWRRLGEALALHRLGRRAEADQALAELEAREGDTMAYQVATARALRGEPALALDWLERALRQEDGGLSDVVLDPSVDSLRAEPRFKALLVRLNLPPDARAR
jgi:TolB-like protein/tetratricopeptide (TPR) repeat protein